MRRMGFNGKKTGKGGFCRRMMLLLLILVFLLPAAGCRKKKEPEPEPIPEEEQVPPEEPVPEPEPEEPPAAEENHDGEVKSLLTGEWIPSEYEGRRPYAVMFNNIKAAYPQSGIGEAGILYEILAEGGISRLLGVFDHLTGDRIGSVRSARHYFVNFASEYDAIFVHYGQTKYADSKMSEMGTNHLNGLSGEGTTVFYRDNSIPAPHNAFASAEGIRKATENKGFRTGLADGWEGHFRFSEEEPVVLAGSGVTDAKEIMLPFSSYSSPSFSYDAEKGLYQRYSYGEQHVDTVTKEPLEFTTLLVQFVNEYNIDKNGYQTMDLEYSSGTGYYITGGKAAPIYWSKQGAAAQTVYSYDSDGTDEVILNPGKIYIAVFPSYQTNALTME